MYFGSKIGKVKERDKLLNLLTINEEETILDVGCGRSLLQLVLQNFLRLVK